MILQQSLLVPDDAPVMIAVFDNLIIDSQW